MARIKAETVGEALRAAGAARMPAEEGRRVRLTGREALARRLWQMALEGDLAACRLVLEYTEGKPVQPIAATIAARVEMVPLTEEELACAAVAVAEWQRGGEGEKGRLGERAKKQIAPVHPLPPSPALPLPVGEDDPA